MQPYASSSLIANSDDADIALKTISFADQFLLIPVCVSSPAYRDSAYRRFLQLVEGEFKALTVSPQVGISVASIELLFADRSCARVAILDVVNDEWLTREVVRAMNHWRGRLEKEWSRPVILVFSESSRNWISEFAPDLWSFRSSTLYFDT